MSKYNIPLLVKIKEKGYKNFQVAELAGIEKARFSRILTGTFQPRDYEKRILCKILKASQKDLFGAN